MSDKMVAPELFRPPIAFPEIPYDHLLRRSAERYPEHVAIIYHDLSLTYREIEAMVNSIANGLRELGLGKGDIICLFTVNRPEYTITLNAAASIGAVISPMNPAYKEREISYQLENCEAKAIVVYRELLPILQHVLSQKTFPHLQHIIVTGNNVPESMPQAIPFGQLLRASSPQRPPAVEIHGNDLLALPYSSGTTGLPKGTMLSHRNLTTNHLQFLTATRITSTDRTIIFLPMYHIYGVMLTGIFLAAGGTQILLERFDMERTLQLCEQYGVTWFFAVPPIILGLANTTDLSRMRSVKYLMNAAAPIPVDPARKFQERTGIPIVQGYGLTESSPDTHFSPLDPARIRLDSAGMIVHNTEQKIVDIETGERELPPGEDGEIVVRGPQVMLGYWKDPEETARVLRDGWLYTGDIGHVDADGQTYIVDRKKEMIKYKAFSIAPAELESLLLEHPAVQDAAVIGIPDDEAGQVPKSFVVLRAGQQASPAELISFVNSKLAGYKKLHAIEFIEAIPKVASGKILRRELQAREQARRAAPQGHA
ncbi:4-coumarate--CoA ligase family protein [Ktedonosporobacter rubrisoli]|uniref:4-coumarate--CoA ligase family protein n=1 Tax=Ktedonosporobacter rubrisoli TaxID=2509675 RepID=A0A4P6JTV0_KTERU|nr:AMP-binding protein [Ktedonosporobacter rubrisoli]QBD78884.1 4-coumarate--CoA ligase family protein [Ktedonosporobacter rubrisoli]